MGYGKVKDLPPSLSLQLTEFAPIENVDLLRPGSLFPSRKLPPLGVRAFWAVEDEDHLQVGRGVQVRNLNSQNNIWNPWCPGWIMGRKHYRVTSGTELTGLIVMFQVNGRYLNGLFWPYLGEVWHGGSKGPSMTIAEREQRRRRLHLVYALVDTPSDMHSQRGTNKTWTAAYLVSSFHEKRYRATVLHGPLEGTDVVIEHFLPYTSGISDLCFAREECVSSSGN